MTRPNVLIIMTDDQGPWAMHCAGTEELITPNLDRLAAEGMRFTDFFCTSPVCSPARASFLTGRIPSQHGVHDWIKSGNIDVEDGVTWCGADKPIEYLAGVPAFTDRLAEAGYLCAISGKWHLGHSGKPQKGHTWWYAHSLGGDSYVDYFAFDNTPDLKHKTQYVTDYFTDRALEFLDEQTDSENPFCLSVHYTAPHAPWREYEQPPEIWSQYDGCDFSSMPVCEPHPWGGWNPSPEKRRETIQGYFTTVTAMDRAVGRIIDRLEELDLRRDTLVFFLSDNGFNVGHHGILGKGNGTYPQNMYDESVKIPFIASCPGRIPEGVVCDAMLSQVDFMPTLLDILGVDDPDATSRPGVSFATILQGRTEDEPRTDVVVFDEYGPVRMIRSRDCKYVRRYPDGPNEFYDLRSDPDEERNRIDDPDMQEVVRAMRNRLTEWFSRYVDPQRDGAEKPVTGLGQIDLSERDGGRDSFVLRTPRP
jgi:arylsulfatase A-like enzyme